MHQTHLQGLLKYRFLGPILGVSLSIEGQESAFLTSAHMLLILLLQDHTLRAAALEEGKQGFGGSGL